MLVLLLDCHATAETLDGLLGKAVASAKQGNYERAQAFYARVTKSFGVRANIIQGAKFGEVYYRKGLTELKLADSCRKNGAEGLAREWFAKAAESFQVCYEKFGNGGAVIGRNRGSRVALQRWAEACMGLKRYEKALELYLKFDKVRQPRDRYLPSLGDYHLSIARCYFLKKDPEIEAGLRHFEMALGKTHSSE